MKQSLSAIILAGGRGSRFDERDKGWIEWNGRPFIHHVIERLQPQAAQLIISCNRNLEAYRALGLPCVTDARPGYGGPLAGISAGLSCAIHDLTLIAPCDTPMLTTDMAGRLLDGMRSSSADICYAWDGQRDQYLIALMKTALKSSLDRYLETGNKSVKGWYGSVTAQRVNFSDVGETFANINTPGELDNLPKEE